MKALFNPGAMLSVVHKKVADRFYDRWRSAHLRIKGVTGQSSNILGILEVFMEVDGITDKIALRIADGIQH